MTSITSEKRILNRFLEWEYLPTGNFSREWSFWIESDHGVIKEKQHLSSKLFIQKLHKVGNFSNVKQLCALWSAHSDEEGQPPIGINFLVFVNGITPAWEDQANSLGGHFIISLHNREKSEQVWYTLLMTMLTEKLEGFKQTELNGMIISPREVNNKIFIWNRFSHNSKFKDTMKSFIVDSLDVPEQYIYYFTNKYKMADAKRKLAQENQQKNERKRLQNQNKNRDPKPTESQDPPQLDNNEDNSKNIEGDASPTSVPAQSQNPKTENRQDNKDKVRPPTEVDEESEEEEEEEVEVLEDVKDQPQELPNSNNSEVNGRGIPLVSEKIEQAPKLNKPPQLIVVEPQPSLFSNYLFTISIGFLIALALIYNIYVIVQR